MEFPFYFFLSSDVNLQAHFIYLFFFFPTSQKIPCRDPSTVEYKAHALSVFPKLIYAATFNFYLLITYCEIFNFNRHQLYEKLFTN